MANRPHTGLASAPRFLRARANRRSGAKGGTAMQRQQGPVSAAALHCDCAVVCPVPSSSCRAPVSHVSPLCSYLHATCISSAICRPASCSSMAAGAGGWAPVGTVVSGSGWRALRWSAEPLCCWLQLLVLLLRGSSCRLFLSWWWGCSAALCVAAWSRGGGGGPSLGPTRKSPMFWTSHTEISTAQNDHLARNR